MTPPQWINTPEWDEAVPHWEAFWAGEVLDRPATTIVVRNPEPLPSSPEAPDPRTRYADAGFLLRLNEAELPRLLYLGEALPVSRVFMGAWCPVYGGTVTCRPEGIWIDDSVPSWDDAPDWTTAWDDGGWKLLTREYARLCGGSGGRYFVGLPPLLVPNDLLAMLRGPQNFLIDLVAEPERVHDALAAMWPNFVRMWNQLDQLRDTSQGYGNWWTIWCPDRLRIVQSDVSCMISGEMFERFILPELHALGEDVEHVFYHLDGPDAIRHLEMICSVPKIKAIQWVPGAGQPGHGLCWMELYKKVQSLGKAIWVSSGPQDLETCVRELDPRKLLLSTSAASADDAHEIERKLAHWTAKYWGTMRG